MILSHSHRRGLIELGNQCPGSMGIQFPHRIYQSNRHPSPALDRRRHRHSEEGGTGGGMDRSNAGLGRSLSYHSATKSLVQRNLWS
jgi:hypothetical protein